MASTNDQDTRSSALLDVDHETTTRTAEEVPNAHGNPKGKETQTKAGLDGTGKDGQVCWVLHMLFLCIDHGYLDRHLSFRHLQYGATI